MLEIRNKSFFLLAIVLMAVSCRIDESAPYDLGKTGSAAHDILSETKYRVMQLEFQYMNDYPIDSEMMNEVISFLNDRCHKQGGFFYIVTQIDSLGNVFTENDVKEIAKKERTIFTRGDTIAIYILVTNGKAPSGIRAAFAFNNTSIAFHGQTEYLKTHPEKKAWIMMHEFCHLMGLVNIGSKMQTPHQDVANGNHCDNPVCLMHWRNLPSPFLDSNCLNDLRANGGK